MSCPRDLNLAFSFPYRLSDNIPPKNAENVDSVSVLLIDIVIYAFDQQLGERWGIEADICQLKRIVYSWENV